MPDFYWGFYPISLVLLIVLSTLFLVLYVIGRRRYVGNGMELHKRMARLTRDYQRRLKILKESLEEENNNLKDKLSFYESKKSSISFLKSEGQKESDTRLAELTKYYESAIDSLIQNQEKQNKKLKEEILRLSKGYHTLVESLREEYKSALKGEESQFFAKYKEELSNLKQASEEKIAMKTVEMKNQQEQHRIEIQVIANELKKALLELDDLKKKLNYMEKAS